MKHSPLTIVVVAMALVATVGGAHAAGIRDAADKQYQYAQGLRQLRIFGEAAREFRVFTQKYPTHKKAGMAAYYRAEAYHEYGSTAKIRAAAQKAVADFHTAYPTHPWKNLGYFLLGEIAMEDALDTERKIGAARRNKESTVKLQAHFESACREAAPAYEKFIEMTDLSKFKAGATRDAMTLHMVTARYNTAQCYIALRQFEKAIAQYRMLLKPEFLDWGPEEAQFMIAQCYFEAGRKKGSGQKAARLKKAILEYKNVMFYGERGRNEFSDDAKLGEAWCLYEMHKYSDCRKLLNGNLKNGFFKTIYDAFKSNPNKIDGRWVRSLGPDIFYLRGKSYFADKTYADALADFERVMNMQGENPWRAEATRMYDECAKRMSAKIDLTKPDAALQAYKVAVNKFLTGNRADAVDEFERIWVEFPGIKTAAFRDYLLYYWAKSLYWMDDQGRLFEAAAIFNYLAKTGNPKAAVEDDRKRRVYMTGEAAYSEGLAYWRLSDEMAEGKEKDAIIHAAVMAFQRLAERNPEHPEAPETLLNVGHFYLGQKEYLKAGLAYRRMVQAYPTHEDAPTALLNLCHVYNKLGQLEDVIWAGDAFEKNFPKRPDVVRAIALKGASWFKQAKEVEDPAKSKELFGRAAAEYGKLRVAQFDWLSSVQKEEFATIFANALFYTGYAREQTGDKPGAIAGYREFTSTAPPDNTHFAEGHVFCAQLYLEDDKYAEAVEVLRPMAEALDQPDDMAHRGMATLVSALLKLGDAEPDAAKKQAFRDEAVAQAKRFYTAYAEVPIHHNSFVAVADAFEQAGLFDEMLAGYEALKANQQLRKARPGLGAAEQRTADVTYERVLVMAGEACGRVALVIEKRGDDTKKFDRAMGDYLAEYTKIAKKRAGAGRLPADYIKVNFLTAEAFTRANEPAKGARALLKNLAVLDETDPRFLKAYYERGNVWLQCGQAKRSLASYIFLIEFADPENPDWTKYVVLSYYQSGIARFRIEETDKAKAAFEALISKFGKSKDAEVQAVVAKAREQLDKIEKLLTEPENTGAAQ